MPNKLENPPIELDSSLDSTLLTLNEVKQIVEQGKKQTEDFDPEVNNIQAEFDLCSTPPTNTQKKHKEVTFKPTSNEWTLATPKDKMKQLRKVKAQERAAKLSAQEAIKKVEKEAVTNAAKQPLIETTGKDNLSSSTKTSLTEEKITYARNVLQTTASKSTGQKGKTNSFSLHEDRTTSKINTNATESKKSKKTKKNSPNITRPFNTYFTLKLKNNTSKNSVKELVKNLNTLFDALQEIDGSLIIYKYKDTVPTSAITVKDEIPNNIARIKDYFSGANPSPREGHVWASMWIGHSEEVENFQTNFKHWSMENDTFLYKKKLQEKQTVRDYFLLYSTDKIDVETLHATVSEEIKRITNREYKFAFVWTVIKAKGRYVNTERTEKKGSQYVKALHVEVPRDEKLATYRMLLKFLGSSSQFNLLGRNLRMTPVPTAETPTHQKTKIIRLIAKQERYLNNIATAITYDLQDIDYTIPSLNKTLRQIIMDIEQVDTSEPLFLSIDFSEFSSGYVLTFPAHVESEARDCISQLPSFLHWMYGDQVLEQLTDFAVERAQDAPWSEELMRAVSQEDTALDNLLDEADQFSWLRNENEVIIEDTPERIATSAFLFHRATNNDSVSTFRTKKSRPDETISPIKKQKANDKNDIVTQDNTSQQVTPDMSQIKKLDTPLLTNNGLAVQSGSNSKQVPLNPTNSIGPLLQTRQAVEDGNRPPDHSSESGVSL